MGPTQTGQAAQARAGGGARTGTPTQLDGCVEECVLVSCPVTSYQKLGGLKLQKFFFHRWPEVQTKVLAGSVPPGGSEGESMPRLFPGPAWLPAASALLGLQTLPSSLCLSFPAGLLLRVVGGLRSPSAFLLSGHLPLDLRPTLNPG